MTTAADSQTLDRFQHAKAEYDRGNYDVAEQEFRSLTSAPGIGIEARYYAGMIRLNGKDLRAAEMDFLEVLRQSPGRLDAMYQLGSICGALRDLPRARHYFQSVVQVNPGYLDASAKLRMVEETIHAPSQAGDSQRGDASTVANLPQPPFRSSVPPVGGQEQAPYFGMDRSDRSTKQRLAPSQDEPGSSHYGVYEALLNSDDPVTVNIITLIDKIQVKGRRPRLSAFLDRILGQCAIGLLIGYILLQLIQSISYWFGSSDDPTLSLDGKVISFWFLIVIVVLAWELINVKTTVYRITRGRVQVVSGVIFRRWRSVELYRVVEVRIDRSFLQLVTDDAALVVVTDRGSLQLEGLGPHGEMEQLAQRLLNLVFYLRANGLVRGIVS